MTPERIEHIVDIEDDEPLLPPREFDDSEMDITPMIDITFLLLIFFIVAARMDKDTPVELPKAKHGTNVVVKSSAIITLAAGPENKAEVYKGDGKSADKKIATTDPEDEEQEIINYLMDEFTAGKSEVLIKAEKNVKHGDVSRVSKAVGKAQKEGANVLYVGVIEQK